MKIVGINLCFASLVIFASIESSSQVVKQFLQRMGYKKLDQRPEFPPINYYINHNGENVPLYGLVSFGVAGQAITGAMIEGHNRPIRELDNDQPPIIVGLKRYEVLVRGIKPTSIPGCAHELEDMHKDRIVKIQLPNAVNHPEMPTAQHQRQHSNSPTSLSPKRCGSARESAQNRRPIQGSFQNYGSYRGTDQRHWS